MQALVSGPKKAQNFCQSQARTWPQTDPKSPAQFTTLVWPSLTKDCMTYQALCWCGKQTQSMQHQVHTNKERLNWGTYQLNCANRADILTFG